MNSKTPSFDAALEEILKDLVPHERICKKCGKSFKVQEEDVAFLKSLRVPPPEECVTCRIRIRRSFVNYTTFFKRKCDVPGHDENMVSLIPDGAPFPVWDFDEYWNGDWDPISYGTDYDSSKPFFDQFRDLMTRVPQPANTRDPMSVNSEYTAYGMELKNCYYVFGGLKSENIMYGNWPLHTKDDVDTLVAGNSERCYSTAFVMDCYRCNFSYNSRNCMDSSFLYDCRNCEHCFGCVNLRNKKYHFFNEPLTKEEYEKKMEGINLGNRDEARAWNEKFREFLRETPKRISFNEHNVNSTGSLLENCKNCHECFFVMGGENLRYTELEMSAKDSMDVLLGTTPEKCYYSVSPYDGSGIYFSSMTRSECQNIEYSMNMKTCTNCFGCIGLVNKSFCIFNKQYSEEEYCKKVDEIKTNMLASGEYGKFFPMRFSPFPYNATLAQISFPISQEKASQEDLWYKENALPEFKGRVCSPDELEKDIRNAPDDVDFAIRSEGSGRLFRITPLELAFYKRENIPLPAVHPEDRLKERFGWFNNLNLEEVTCSRCDKKVIGTPPVSADENFLCGECFSAGEI